MFIECPSTGVRKSSYYNSHSNNLLKGSGFVGTEGQHFIIDAFECRSDILNNEEQLKQLLTKAVDEIGMEILSTHFHSFTPQGVTGLIGLSTSHFSIHTWPEHGYAAFDLYTCGNYDLWSVLKGIFQKFEAQSVMF